jgi:hypothetical protein
MTIHVKIMTLLRKKFISQKDVNNKQQNQTRERYIFLNWSLKIPSEQRHLILKVVSLQNVRLLSKENHMQKSVHVSLSII